MLTRRLPFMCALAALAVMWLASPRQATAGSANAKHIAADAKWYIHFDAEIARKTEIFKQVLEMANAQWSVADFAGQLKQMIGINPLEDITGITVWNNSFEKDVAVIMIYAKVDQNMLSNAIANNPDYKQIAYGKHTMHSWTDNNDGKTKTGAFWGDGVILMGDKMDTLKTALDVLDEKKEGGSKLVKEAPKGAFLCAAANLAEAGDKNLSTLLQNGDAATACAFEDDGKFNLQLNLTAKDAATASQLKSLLDGVKAFGELGAKDLPTAQSLIRKVNVALDGQKLMASFQHDSKTLIETLMKLDQENKARQGGGGGGIQKATPPAEKPNGL